jgi:hypothetical protein
MLTSVLIYGACCWLVLRSCTRLRVDRATIFVVAAAFPGFFYMVASGQNSALALIAFTAAYFALRARRPLLAGMALGLLMYKPQFGVVAAVVFVLTLEWKVVAGALITAGGQLAAGGLYYGRAVLHAYYANLVHINQNASALEPHLDRMHGLRSFWLMLIPWHGIASVLYAASALAAVVITVWCWKSEARLELRYAVFLLGTALVDPHLTDYDLVILVPALLFIGEYVLLSHQTIERDWARLLTYAVYCLPLFGPMLKTVHVQLSVPAFAGLFLVLAAVTRKKMNETAASEQTCSAAVSSLPA